MFIVELWHLGEKVVVNGEINEAEVMLAVLGLIDVVMIANPVKNYIHSFCLVT